MTHGCELLVVLLGSGAVSLFFFSFFILPGMRRFHHQALQFHEESVYTRLHYLTAQQNAKSSFTQKPELTPNSEYVHLKAVGKSICLVQAGGRRFLKVEGQISTQEKDCLIHYLKAEGFLE